MSLNCYKLTHWRTYMEPTTNTELETAERQYWVEASEALERLEKNPDFKKVILDGYLEQKVLDSVSLLAHPAIKQRGERADVMEDLVAASNLKYYMGMIKNMGAITKDEILDEEMNQG